MTPITVCALYKFVRLERYQDLRQPLHGRMLEHGVRGTILLAREGINGTIAGARAGVDAVITWLENDAGLGPIDRKDAISDEAPFRRTKVKLKKEIVTMGVADIDPATMAGTYVEPEDWNRLLDDPELLLLDTRNDYEYAVGTFENAINPHTTSFREFPDFVENHLDPARHRKVAMFCTGGIRCEKSTALLNRLGFDEVYHLKGGILNYLARVPEEESRWRGECFVFDERVTVDHRLQPGGYDQCHACRLPVSSEDKRSPLYQEGVSCPQCHDRVAPADRERFAERQRQVQLALSRGRAHIGTAAMPADHPSLVGQRGRPGPEGLVTREGEST